MLRNLGTIDFLVRIVMGEVLMIGACFAPGVWRWMAAPGAMLMLTAALAHFSIDIESDHSFSTNAHPNSDKRRHLG